MPEDYNPQDYWERRLRERDTLSSVGHRSYSDRYNVWLYRAQEAALGRLLHNIAVELRGLSILDVGSGTGYWLDWYNRRGAGPITAVELSPSAATRLRAKYPDVTVIQGDVSAPQVSLPVADLVNVQSVLYHIVEPLAFAQALRNLASSLRPGGWLVLSDRLGALESYDAAHCRFRALREYEHVLPSLGFTIMGMEAVYVLLNGGLREMARWPHWRIERLVYLGEETMAPLLYAVDKLPWLGRWANLRMLIAQRAPISSA